MSLSSSRLQFFRSNPDVFQAYWTLGSMLFSMFSIIVAAFCIAEGEIGLSRFFSLLPVFTLLVPLIDDGFMMKNEKRYMYMLAFALSLLGGALMNSECGPFPLVMGLLFAKFAATYIPAALSAKSPSR